MENKQDSEYSESKGLALATKLPILIGLCRRLSFTTYLSRSSAHFLDKIAREPKLMSIKMPTLVAVTLWCMKTPTQHQCLLSALALAILVSTPASYSGAPATNASKHTAKEKGGVGDPKGAGVVSSGVELPPIPPATGSRKAPVASWGHGPGYLFYPGGFDIDVYRDWRRVAASASAMEIGIAMKSGMNVFPVGRLVARVGRIAGGRVDVRLRRASVRRMSRAIFAPQRPLPGHGRPAPPARDVDAEMTKALSA